ncbi:hypothetical protein AB1Y20_007532 [Prymnesium parvum]|uniref:Uncharacterized protein n=1 Tax=Prymnesium parvum TaxID=97485 RepID=A0AB34IX96_PRYPA
MALPAALSLPSLTLPAFALPSLALPSLSLLHAPTHASTLRAPPPRLSAAAAALSAASPAGAAFHQEVLDWLEGEGLQWTDAAHLPPAHTHTDRPVLLVGALSSSPTVALHLLHTPRAPSDVLPPHATAAFADAWEEEPRGRTPLPLVHLWEDEWRQRAQIVRSRLLAMTGRSRRLFARRLKVRRVDAATLEAFLLKHHLWGPTKARFRYGLFETLDSGEDLVAVASFSSRRHVHRAGVRFRSHELIRYCSRRGVTVVGGISKLIAAFTRELEPDDIITVVDRNWGAGDGWGSFGFEQVQRMPPSTFFVGSSGERCHVYGSGRNPYRRQLPSELVDDFARVHNLNRPISEEDLGELTSYLQACLTQAEHAFFPVHDAGAKRLLLLLSTNATQDYSMAQLTAESDSTRSTAQQMWLDSNPSYPERYYLELVPIKVDL